MAVNAGQVLRDAVEGQLTITSGDEGEQASSAGIHKLHR
jgi:hypothetical protein